MRSAGSAMSDDPDDPLLPANLCFLNLDGLSGVLRDIYSKLHEHTTRLEDHNDTIAGQSGVKLSFCLVLLFCAQTLSSLIIRL